MFYYFQCFLWWGDSGSPPHQPKICSFSPTSKNRTQVVLISILIDVQYLQNAVSSFEKGWNSQNHPCSDRKNFPPAKKKKTSSLNSHPNLLRLFRKPDFGHYSKTRRKIKTWGLLFSIYLGIYLSHVNIVILDKTKRKLMFLTFIYDYVSGYLFISDFFSVKSTATTDLT